MSKLDLMNKDYTFGEIIDAFTDGSIDNFKGDNEFLKFFIYGLLGEEIISNEVDLEYKEKYTGYLNSIDLVFLDENDIMGKDLYKIYEICNKDKMKFLRTIFQLRLFGNDTPFTKNDVVTNLKLSYPVDFIDENIVLSDGTKEFNFEKDRNRPYKKLNREQTKEYYYRLRHSFVTRINESIINNGDSIPLLEVPLSFEQLKEKERQEKLKQQEQKVKNDYKISVQNIYFGKQTIDISGGVLGINMTTVSWFEYTNMKFLNYFIFRNIPGGEYFLIDNEGKVFIPNKNMLFNNINFGPNNIVRDVSIGSIPTLIKLSIRKLEEDPIENEIQILQLKALLEHFEIVENIQVKELYEYESLIRAMYEKIMGPIFSSSDENEKSQEKNHK